MSINRIVSFLPSATELIYELGDQEKLFGVTHECKYPENAKTKLQVINSVFNSEKLTSDEIDKMTCKLLKEGKDIFVLNKKNLLKANPDLIISQETCEVCAAYTNQVNEAMKILQKKIMIHSMNPHNLQEIIQSVTKMGEILKKEETAKKITESLMNRIEVIQSLSDKMKPKVLAIEWIEPFFTAGHWIPEMIEVSGGINLISKTGEHSRRLSIQEIIRAEPDIIIIMPCGFDVKRAISEYDKILKNNQKWNLIKAVKTKNVFAVDANSFFSKPSIRTITGLEILAKIIHPQNTVEISTPKNSWSRLR